MKKKRGIFNLDEQGEHSARDFIKLSDIKASTALIIENVRRTESSKLDRFAFDQSMRQASTHFHKDVSSKSMLARPKEMSAAIMEVDESGLDQTQGNLVAQVMTASPEDTDDKNTHYFSYHNQEDDLLEAPVISTEPPVAPKSEESGRLLRDIAKKENESKKNLELVPNASE